MPKATQSTTVATPIHAGMARRCQSTPASIFRQDSAGATAIKKSRARPTGTAMALKYGAPTVTCWPRSAS